MDEWMRWKNSLCGKWIVADVGVWQKHWVTFFVSTSPFGDIVNESVSIAPFVRVHIGLRFQRGHMIYDDGGGGQRVTMQSTVGCASQEEHISVVIFSSPPRCV